MSPTEYLSLAADVLLLAAVCGAGTLALRATRALRRLQLGHAETAAVITALSDAIEAARGAMIGLRDATRDASSVASRLDKAELAADELDSLIAVAEAVAQRVELASSGALTVVRAIERTEQAEREESAQLSDREKVDQVLVIA
jgi:hypothetical protein